MNRYLKAVHNKKGSSRNAVIFWNQFRVETIMYLKKQTTCCLSKGALAYWAMQPLLCNNGIGTKLIDHWFQNLACVWETICFR